MRKLGLMVLLVTLLGVLPGWAATAPKKAAATTKESDHFSITSDLPPAYMEAVLKLCETSLDGYRDLFGFSLYPNPNPGDKRTAIFAMRGTEMVFSSDWTKRPGEMHLTVPAGSGLTPAGQVVPWLFFRFGWALSAPLACYDNPRFNQGLQDYFGAQIVDYAAGKLTPKSGPTPFDYVQLVGSGSLERVRATAKPGSAGAAAGLLDRLANTYGKDTLGKAMRLLGTPEAVAKPIVVRPGAPPVYKVAALCQQLINLTNEGEIERWFQEQHFATVLDPRDVTAAELWALTDANARCRLLCQRWGTSTTGILNGSPVQIILQVASGEQAKTLASTPEGVTVKAADNKGVIAWYQPATKRVYVLGKVELRPSGAFVQDDAINEKGEAMHLREGK